MAVKKVSVSLPAEVLQAALAAAQAEGLALSSWLTDAVRQRLQADQAIDVGYQAAQQLVVEFESAHGPLPPEAQEWAQAVWADAQLSAGSEELPGQAAS